MATALYPKIAQMMRTGAQAIKSKRNQKAQTSQERHLPSLTADAPRIIRTLLDDPSVWGLLTEWETNFLMNLSSHLDAGRPLTEKQLDCLSVIWAKVTKISSIPADIWEV